MLRHILDQYKAWQLIMMYVVFSLTLTSCATYTKKTVNPGLRNALIEAALAMQNTPYRYGGNTPNGFDCSGLVQYAHKKIGITVPRTSYTQYQKSKPVRIKQLQIGDLIFFKTSGRLVSHVGIYIGKQQFVHAPGSHRRVSTDSLTDRYWQKRIVGAGSFL